MATDTMNPDFPVTQPGVSTHRGLGYAGPVVEIKSGDFIVSLIKFLGWGALAVGIPVGLALLGLAVANWMNFEPAFYTGEMYHGFQLFKLVAATVGGVLAWSIITAFVLFWSFLGMASAFEAPEKPYSRI